MTAIHKRRPRIADALAELERMIRVRFPEASFETVKGYDPPGTYLEVSVPAKDFDDAFEEIFDTVGDRLLDFQDRERLRIYVMPVHHRESVA